MKENFLKKLNYLINIGINNVVHGIRSISKVLTVALTDRIYTKRT